MRKKESNYKSENYFSYELSHIKRDRLVVSVWIQAKQIDVILVLGKEGA